MSGYSINNQAVLFLRALWDIWAAERTWFGDPNIAVWQCVLAAEKTMKGFLVCSNIDFENVHELPELLENVETIYRPTEEYEASVIFLSRYKSGLRYKNLKNDPTPEDARLAISHAKRIINEISIIPTAAKLMEEAREVHDKVLKSNSTKYSTIDISKDVPEDS
jgi:HEPN domain-containing protein